MLRADVPLCGEERDRRRFPMPKISLAGTKPIVFFHLLSDDVFKLVQLDFVTVEDDT